jgi:pilus assembly protein CpaD
MRPVLSFKLLPPLALAVTAAACASGGDQGGLAMRAVTPVEQFPIQVTQAPDEIQMRAHPQGISPAQQQALAELVYRWRAGGAGPITINAPTAGGQAVAVAAVEASRGYMASLGVSPENIRVAGYPAEDGPPVLRVGYLGYRAAGPSCGVHWDNLAANSGNEVWSNFGCAVTANIAAQVSNPRDFLTPRGQDPADATRRSMVLDKYRKGEISAGEVDEKSKGAISEAVRDN